MLCLCFVLADDRSRYNRNKATMMDILDTLSSAMNLLRRCRVNAALTIQLFSQLFHFINMWVFNILVTEKSLRLCTRVWGVRLKRRLARVEAWAEKQGLELAADCHLCRIIQVGVLTAFLVIKLPNIAIQRRICYWKLDNMKTWPLRVSDAWNKQVIYINISMLLVYHWTCY